MAIDRPLKRGQIWLLEWEPHRGSEQGGIRPSVIVQADEANELEYYNNTIVLAMSTIQAVDEILHVSVEPSRLNGLTRPGVVRCEQIITVSRTRLIKHLGQIEPRHLKSIDAALKTVLGLR